MIAISPHRTGASLKLGFTSLGAVAYQHRLDQIRPTCTTRWPTAAAASRVRGLTPLPSRVRLCGLELLFHRLVALPRIDAPYAPGNGGCWRKSKSLNRQEFVVVGWTDPEAGRVWNRMSDKVMDPSARVSMPLCVPQARKTRFGSPLVLSRVHWVEPQLVAEITYLTWTVVSLLLRRSPQVCPCAGDYFCHTGV
jgi:hypothetical protein